jgi:hypothetical protein
VFDCPRLTLLVFHFHLSQTPPRKREVNLTMAPAPVRAKYTNSESVFKPDIFKGKVLFCTGGGSGICKEMTYAVVSSYSLPFAFESHAEMNFWYRR